ncbi:phosphatidylcholine:diacylglycerol cholinephosphotransferase 1-like [Zingiber officinale]|nr:phosphatidylcholine:diacylglycerol cholinephosphotransferase 1-like [Zingiber officinale]
MTAESGVRSTTQLRVRRRTANTARVTLGIAHHENAHHRKAPSPLPLFPSHGPFFARWSVLGVAGALRRHLLPCSFTILLLVFMGVEYTIPMVPSSSPPLDLGFALTKPLNAALAAAPALNTALAALNTVFVGMQTFYILWTFLVEGRPRPIIAALFMFPCRGFLGCSTQLPLPQGFLGSGVDFPVGNVSFFLFFSGHVAGAVIASLDMRRTQRHKMAWAFDALNLLQSVRLLASRGHYTIDLAVGVGAGFVADVLAGKYEVLKWKPDRQRASCSCRCSCRTW